MLTGILEMDGHEALLNHMPSVAYFEAVGQALYKARECGAHPHQSKDSSSSSSSEQPGEESSSNASSLSASTDPHQSSPPPVELQIASREPEAIEDDHLGHAEKTRLELILGPVGSGKSTELSRRLQRKKLYKRVFALSTIEDTRYGDSGIITHDGLVTQCLRVKNLSEALTHPEYQRAEVVGIDEAGFFNDLPEFIRQQLEITRKTFIISGLDGDRHKKPFGRVLELIPDADRKDFLAALCKRCADGTEAPFSIEVVAFEGQVKVGGTDSFEAVCRRHYDSIRYCQRVDALKRSHPELQLNQVTFINH